MSVRCHSSVSVSEVVLVHMTASTCCSRGPGNGDEFLGILLALPCALTEGPPNIGVGVVRRSGVWVQQRLGIHGDGFCAMRIGGTFQMRLEEGLLYVELGVGSHENLFA